MAKEIFGNIEADIAILSKAKKKFEKCDQKDSSFDKGSCRLFLYTFDTTMDVFHHCGSCKYNTKDPTTSRDDVRYP